MNEEGSMERDQIWQQLENAQTVRPKDLTPSPDEQKRILKERAHHLAREQEMAADPRDLLEVVEFELAGERYGFELACVRAVGVLKDLTPVPCAPAFVLGIINLRGEIHTVIDLKKFFDLPNAGITELNKVLIVEGEGMRLGVLADAIRGVRAIPYDAFQSSLPTLTGVRAEYLKGVTSERLIVLEISKILSDSAILVRDDALP